MKLFIILGNQLFNPSYLKKFSDHTFYMSEDYELCTFQKHHKLKILFFLSAMRSYKDELKNKKMDVIYDGQKNSFKDSYIKKLERIIKDKKVQKVTFFEIEDKFFEKKIISFLKKNKIDFNQIESPMFITTRKEFKSYLDKNKKPLMANFYKINRAKLNLLVEKDGKPRGGKWSFDEDNRKKLPDKIKIPDYPKIKETTHTIELKSFVEKNFKNHPGSTKYFWFPTTRKHSLKLLENF